MEEELIRRVDDVRGDVPRSVFIARAVEAALNGASQTLSSVPDPAGHAVASAQPAVPPRAPERVSGREIARGVRAALEESSADPKPREPAAPRAPAESPAMARQRKLNEGKYGR